ncbi:MAG: ribosome silencing factor [Microbacteriaceae bacterium]|nr:ribosome silencing factor [Cryobacterium sp.]MBX3104656.1 ribosome silencing factor [Cryobacterium sp.]MCC6375826.1 ribosome silencing factor [Microbacteriaceae bacterium]
MTVSKTTLRDLSTAIEAAESKQAEDLVALDVSLPLPFAEVFLLASGRSERQVLAIAEEIEDRLRDIDVKPLRREGRREGRWVLLDFGDLVVHVFHQEERMYYSLERIWKDCPVIPLGS